MGYTDTPIGGGIIRRTISGSGTVQDAHMQFNVYTWNFGAGNGLAVGNPDFGAGSETARYNSVIRISDLNAIPSQPIVGFRFCSLRLPNATYSINPNYIDAYFLKDSNTWVEGTANGAAQVGSVAWGYKQYPTPWTGGTQYGGAHPTLDVDADATPPSASYIAYTSGPGYLLTLPLKSTWPSLWKMGARVNNGIVIRSRAGVINDFCQLVASTYPTPSYFEIDYVAPIQQKYLMVVRSK